MICPECNGKGETIYYVEIDRDENTFTAEQRKGICRTCNGSGQKTQTNADRIRAMSDEDLANWLDYMYGRCDWCDTNKVGTDDCSDIACTDCIFEWLKQPAETNANPKEV